MEKKELLRLDYLPHMLANVLYEHGRLLQEGAREGRHPARLRLDRDACFEVAKRQVAELLDRIGVVEIWCRAEPSHSWPPRDPPAGKT
jgi:hypothetical protein